MLVELCKNENVLTGANSTKTFRCDSVSKIFMSAIKETTNINFKDVSITVLIGTEVVVQRIPWAALSMIFAIEEGGYGTPPGDQTVAQYCGIDLGQYPLGDNDELTVRLDNADAEGLYWDCFAEVNVPDSALPIRYFHSTGAHFGVDDCLRLYVYKDDGALVDSNVDYSLKGDNFDASIDVSGAHSKTACLGDIDVVATAAFIAEVHDFGGTPHTLDINITGTAEETIAVCISNDVASDVKKIVKHTDRVMKKMRSLTTRQRRGQGLVHRRFMA